MKKREYSHEKEDQVVGRLSSLCWVARSSLLSVWFSCSLGFSTNSAARPQSAFRGPRDKSKIVRRPLRAARPSSHGAEEIAAHSLSLTKDFAQLPKILPYAVTHRVNHSYCDKADFAIYYLLAYCVVLLFATSFEL